MKNNFKKIFALSSAAAIFLTGCGAADNGTLTPDIQPDSFVSQPNNYGQVITALDVKNKYNSTDDGIMPLYNVAEDEAFDVDFKVSYQSAFYDSQMDYHPVTVHTDPSCSEASEVVTYSYFAENADGTTRVTVAPVAPVLATEYQEDDYMENEHATWGNAPVYYLAIWYDAEAETAAKLETPVVIPFTVKHEVEAPNAKGVVDSTGRFKIVWDPVEGATEYRIYTMPGGNWTGSVNNPVSGADSAFSDPLVLDATTTETQYDNFAGEGHGLAVHTSSVDGYEYVIGQNYCVCGDYYVSAVVDGKESGFCAPISTHDLKLPYQLTEECDIMFERYSDVSEFPLTLDVVNIDGSVTSRRVKYTFQWRTSYTGDKHPGYMYEIEGTALSGCVGFEEYEPDKEYPETVGSFSTTGGSQPENDVDLIPDSDVETIIPVESDENQNTDAENDENTTLVQQQTENTEAHVENGNNDTVENPQAAVVFADSAEEEWLALNLINGETEISLEAFPKLQQANVLCDVFNKVYYQNPYILGVYSYSYDYASLTFNVKYVYDKETIKAKQQEISAEAAKVVSQTITESMSDDEKRLAIYDYLEANCRYDTDALADAENNDFKKTEDGTYEDSFNTYGILVNKKGVCQSYAYTYKLLCHEAGLDCVVVTGYLNGNLPHAWNAVEIDGSWYQTDSTNNGKTTGIPYFLYNCDSDTAEATGFTVNDSFELDSELSKYETDDDSHEYYAANGLAAETLDQYAQAIENNLDSDDQIIVVKFYGEMPEQQDIINTAVEAFNRMGMEDMLQTARIVCTNTFIAIALA